MYICSKVTCSILVLLALALLSVFKVITFLHKRYSYRLQTKLYNSGMSIEYSLLPLKHGGASSSLI